MKRFLAGIALALVAITGFAHDVESGAKPHTHWWLEMADLDLSWYAGAGVGQSRFGDYTIPNDGSFISQSKDDTGTTLRLFGGMGVGKFLALELGYVDFGEASFRAQSDGSGGTWNAGPQSIKIGVDGYDVSLVGRLPIGEAWGLFVKLGETWWDAEAPLVVDSQCCGAFDVTLSDDGNEFTYGGGVQYDGLRPIRIAAEYGALPLDAQITTGEEMPLDWLAISVAYLF